jgi:two-component system phosphate regulon sensor histidine kinase PhoR
MDRLCKDAAGQTITRVTVILPDGRVVGDSEEMPARMASHLDREEIRDAYLGKVGVSIRHSDTLKQDMMYVALPLVVENILSGVLRTSIPVTAIDERMGAIRWRIGLRCVADGPAGIGGQLVAFPKITRLWKNAGRRRRFAAGVLTHRMRFMTSMSSPPWRNHEPDGRTAAAAHRRDYQPAQEDRAVLSSMREGVIATDMEQRVISINPAAARMFGVPKATVQGRSVLEIIRNHEFQELMDQSLSTGESLESDIVYHQNGERTFNVHCTPLIDALQKRHGGIGSRQRRDPTAAPGKHAA